MSPWTVPVELEADELVTFHLTGTAASGEYRCSACGYGIAISAVLPLCPMCGGETWELVERRPLPGVVPVDA